MTDEQKNNDNSYESLKNKKSYLESDTQDMIRQLSQITQSDDKSFESSMMNTKNFPKFYEFISDKNKLSKDSNLTTLTPAQIFNEKDLKINYDINDNSLINNNYTKLNQKLKYICSLIQISKINIKKYDDLRQFNKFIYKNDIIINDYDPINILLDVITELVFYVQKKVKDNDILMHEIKRLRYNMNDKDKQIYKLKISNKGKDNELNELRAIKKDEYFKYNLNEINKLKQENKELYKKINTYKTQMKKVESYNKEILSKLNSFNNKERKTNQYNNSHLSNNNSNNIQNLHSKNELSNSYDETKYNIIKKKIKFKRNNLNNSNYKFRTINNSPYFSPMKTTDDKKLNEKEFNRNTINGENINKENNSNNNKGVSIVSNMRLLLKEINELLNKYNSLLDKVKIGNNINTNNLLKKSDSHQNQAIIEDKKINFINKDFFNKMDNIIKKMENNIKEDDKNKSQSTKKFIQVNTSKFIYKKRSIFESGKPKNYLKKINININNNYSSSSNLRRCKILKKGIKMNLTDNYISS